MQKNIAKGLAVGSLTLIVGLTSFGSLASAKSVNATPKVKNTHVTTRVATTHVAKGHVRTLPGKVVSMTETTLVMKKGNTTYTVSVTGITPVNRKGVAIALTDIKAGHKVSIRGTVTGTAVTKILKLRDITLPVSTKTGTAK